MAERPIGVFDSGVGGLTVLKAIRDKFPSQNLIYFGDTARVPYGNRSPKTIIRYSIENAKLLQKFNIKALIVACNTSSSYALEVLREEFPFPVLGVIKPGASLSVSVSRNRKIGVIGTEATVKSGSYRREILSIDPFATVYEKACPLFVPLIEEGWLEDKITELVARKYLKGLVGKGIDTLILGCTHYPLIKRTIKKIVGEGINIVDSAEAVATEVEKILGKDTEKGKKGKVRILVSDKTDRFERLAEMIMGEETSIEEVSIE